VVDLEICSIFYLEGAALGACLSDLIRNIHTQRLNCSVSTLGVDGARAFQPGLQVNRTLKQLILDHCELGNEGAHVIADALVGNTTMELFDVTDYRITSKGLVNITRMIESTRLQTIDFAWRNYKVFDNEENSQHFAASIQKNVFVE
jgi:Leucine Rich repeat